MFTIYHIENKTNLKAYVGQTSYPLNKRWNDHVSDSLRGKENNHFSRAIRKYGKDGFTLAILATVDTKEKADVLEKLWIASLQTRNDVFGYNTSIGGDGGEKGVYPDHLKRVNDARVGKPEILNEAQWGGLKAGWDAAKYRIITPEAKKKMSLAKLGKHVSEETKRKISVANKGKRHNMTEEGSRRIGEAVSKRRKGSKVSEETKKFELNISIEGIDNGERFNNEKI
jgi:group I intron endonuclease